MIPIRTMKPTSSGLTPAGLLTSKASMAFCALAPSSFVILRFSSSSTAFSSLSIPISMQATSAASSAYA
jgi:hypothetical protein